MIGVINLGKYNICVKIKVEYWLVMCIVLVSL